jgi:hypothetical protein
VATTASAMPAPITAQGSWNTPISWCASDSTLGR